LKPRLDRQSQPPGLHKEASVTSLESKHGTFFITEKSSPQRKKGVRSLSPQKSKKVISISRARTRSPPRRQFASAKKLTTSNIRKVTRARSCSAIRNTSQNKQVEKKVWTKKVISGKELRSIISLYCSYCFYNIFHNRVKNE
jgi:hypothetical protein